MERSRITRYLRIAVTALSLTACVLLIALWVRSYKKLDQVYGQFKNNPILSINSFEGGLDASAVWTGWPVHSDFHRWQIQSIDIPEEREFWIRDESDKGFIGFYLAKSDANDVMVASVPHWFVILLAAGLATAPWISQLKSRFSLRTLLIAMTLVAIGLGAIIYLAR